MPVPSGCPGPRASGLFELELPDVLAFKEPFLRQQHAREQQLLSSIGRLSAAGSRVAFEHGSSLDAATAARAVATPGMAAYASLWKGGLGRDTAQWLTEHGWSVRMHDRAALAGSYGRAWHAESPVPDDVQQQVEAELDDVGLTAPAQRSSRIAR